MKCKNCGHEVLDDDLFCENCGTKVERIVETRSGRHEAKKKKNNKIIIGVILLMLLVGGGVFAYQKILKGDKPDYQPTTEEKEKKLKITPTKLKIEIGENKFIDCNVKGVTFESSDTDIATVSTSGRVKGISVGEVEITVTYEDQEKICKVTVGEEQYTTISNSGDYVFSQSNTTLLTVADLEGKTPQQLKIGRNEIYARHGRKFTDTSLQSYFNSKSWYHGTIEADAFDESVLNEIEKKNAEFISTYEHQNQ